MSMWLERRQRRRRWQWWRRWKNELKYWMILRIKCVLVTLICNLSLVRQTKKRNNRKKKRKIESRRISSSRISSSFSWILWFLLSQLLGTVEFECRHSVDTFSIAINMVIVIHIDKTLNFCLHIFFLILFYYLFYCCCCMYAYDYFYQNS